MTLEVSSGKDGGVSQRPIPSPFGEGGRGKSQSVFGEARRSPQLSSGAEEAPQSPHGWAGLFRGARTPPSYRREPEEGGDPGQTGPPPPRRTLQDPFDREEKGGKARRGGTSPGPLKKERKNPQGEKKKR